MSTSDGKQLPANEVVDSETASTTSETNSDPVVVQNADAHGMSSNLRESQALMSLIKGNLGTGMLSMLVVLRYAGLWTGFFLIIFAGAVSTYLMHVLVRTAKSVRERNGLERSKIEYSETVFFVFKYGPERLRQPKGKIKHTVNTFLIVTQIGFCCVYVLFITENIIYFVRAFTPYPLNTFGIAFGVCLVLIPICLWSDLKVLAYLSLVANLATIVGMVFIFAYLFTSESIPIQALPSFTDFRGLLIGSSIVMFSFEGISLVLPIQNKMAAPDGYTAWNGVLNTGMGIVVSLNLAIGFFGYLAFGDEAKGSITLNIPVGPPFWFAPIKPLFLIAIFVSFLLQFYVPAAIFGRLMEKMRCHREASDRRRLVNLKLMRVALVLFAYLVVISIPRLDLMISLIGSLASSMLAFILPPLIEIVHLWGRRNEIPWFWLTVVAKHSVFIILGLISFIGGTVATLMQLIEAFQESHHP